MPGRLRWNLHAGRAQNPTSSLLKNLEIGALPVFLRWGLGRSDVVKDADLCRQQFGNADQVVGDQIEHEVGRDAG
jgi:hypothetical protein